MTTDRDFGIDTKQSANWRRTSAIIVVLAAVVFAPFVIAKASHDNWNVNDLTSRFPWNADGEVLAGDVTTDAAAAAVCTTTPTFNVTAATDGALLQLDGPLSLEQANMRLAELGVRLELGLLPSAPVGPHPALARISHGGGDTALAEALDESIDPRAPLIDAISVPAESGAVGLVLTCPSTQ